MSFFSYIASFGFNYLHLPISGHRPIYTHTQVGRTGTGGTHESSPRYVAVKLSPGHVNRGIPHYLNLYSEVSCLTNENITGMVSVPPWRQPQVSEATHHHQEPCQIISIRHPNRKLCFPPKGGGYLNHVNLIGVLGVDILAVHNDMSSATWSHQIATLIHVDLPRVLLVGLASTVGNLLLLLAAKVQTGLLGDEIESCFSFSRRVSGHPGRAASEM